jgi:hypothetical protein
MCLGLIPAGTAGAIGIRLNTFGEVLVENLAIGESYSMLKLMNQPFEVAYKGDTPTNLRLEVKPPLPSELKPGFEAVPDVSWVSLGNSLVAVAANGTYRTDVKITVPKDKKYLGKKYMAFLTVRLLPPKGGLGVGVELAGKLLFTIAPMEKPLRSSDQPAVNLKIEVIKGSNAASPALILRTRL